MKIDNTKDALKRHWMFVLAILSAAGFLFWKCQFGFGNIDESFYITIPYRLFQGDALFLQEWHLSQMAGVITMPFVAAYVGIEDPKYFSRIFRQKVGCTCKEYRASVLDENVSAHTPGTKS